MRKITEHLPGVMVVQQENHNEVRFEGFEAFWTQRNVCIRATYGIDSLNMVLGTCLQREGALLDDSTSAFKLSLRVTLCSLLCRGAVEIAILQAGFTRQLPRKYHVLVVAHVGGVAYLAQRTGACGSRIQQ